MAQASPMETDARCCSHAVVQGVPNRLQPLAANILGIPVKSVFAQDFVKAGFQGGPVPGIHWHLLYECLDVFATGSRSPRLR